MPGHLRGAGLVAGLFGCGGDIRRKGNAGRVAGGRQAEGQLLVEAVGKPGSGDSAGDVARLEPAQQVLPEYGSPVGRALQRVGVGKGDLVVERSRWGDAQIDFSTGLRALPQAISWVRTVAGVARRPG